MGTEFPFSKVEGMITGAAREGQWERGLDAERILILGPAAAGKSTLARSMAGKHGLPLLELDTLYWDDESPDYGVKRDPDERDRRLAQIAAREAWVLEGIYYAWTRTALERADRIVFLDAPLWHRQWRILRRFVLRKLGLEPSHKKDSLRGLLGLMAWDRRWDRVHRGPMMQALEPFQAKVHKPGIR
jgi:adenylate kinase family enzyme